MLIIILTVIEIVINTMLIYPCKTIKKHMVYSLHALHVYDHTRYPATTAGY